MPEAAAVIVKACRYHLQDFYGIPGADVIERGIRFSQEAEEAWVQGGGRLASTLNYALVRGTRRTEGKENYHRKIIADTNLNPTPAHEPQKANTVDRLHRLIVLIYVF